MVTITKLSSGILFDASAVPGPATGVTNALKMFLPLNYPSINNISLFNDRIVGTGSLGRQFNLTLNGADQSFPVSLIGTENNLQQPQDLSDLFDKWIAIL